MTGLGYVRVEEVIGVRNPVYDEDAVLVETLQQMGVWNGIRVIGESIFGSHTSRAIRNYEAASRRMIEEGLAKII